MASESSEASWLGSSPTTMMSVIELELDLQPHAERAGCRQIWQSRSSSTVREEMWLLEMLGFFVCLNRALLLVIVVVSAHTSSQ